MVHFSHKHQRVTVSRALLRHGQPQCWYFMIQFGELLRDLISMPGETRERGEGMGGRRRARKSSDVIGLDEKNEHSKEENANSTLQLIEKLVVYCMFRFCQLIIGLPVQNYGFGHIEPTCYIPYTVLDSIPILQFNSASLDSHRHSDHRLNSINI